MITTIKVWSKNGAELATFQSTLHENAISNISLNDAKSFMADINRTSGNAMHYGETLVVSINESEKDKVMNKLKEIFRDFKQIISGN